MVKEEAKTEQQKLLNWLLNKISILHRRRKSGYKEKKANGKIDCTKQYPFARGRANLSGGVLAGAMSK